MNERLETQRRFWLMLALGILLVSLGVWAATKAVNVPASASASVTAATPSAASVPEATSRATASCAVVAAAGAASASCAVEAVGPTSPSWSQSGEPSDAKSERDRCDPSTSPTPEDGDQSSTSPPTINDGPEGCDPFVTSFWPFWVGGTALLLILVLMRLLTLYGPRSGRPLIQMGRLRTGVMTLVPVVLLPVLPLLTLVLFMRWADTEAVPWSADEFLYAAAGTTLLAIPIGALVFLGLLLFDRVRLAQPEATRVRFVAGAAIVLAAAAIVCVVAAVVPLAPSYVDWAAIVLGALLIARQVARWAGRREPGAVAVEKVTDATGTKLEVDGLTAIIRERLGQAGLLGPPLVPGGQLSQQLIDVVAEAPAPHAKWAAKVLTAFRAVMPARSYEIATVLQGKASEATATVEIKDADTKASVNVKKVAGTSFEDVAERAAYHVYAWIWSRPDPAGSLKPWERWADKDGNGVRKYQEGLRSMRAQPDEAIGHLRRALKLEPLNVFVAHKLGNVLENSGRQLEALETYLDAVRRWPSLAAPRYRLGAVYASVEPLTSAVVDISPAKRDELAKKLLRAEEGELPASGDRQELAKFFLERSEHHVEHILEWGVDPSEATLPARFRAALQVSRHMVRVARQTVDHISPTRLKEGCSGALTDQDGKVLKEGMKAVERSRRGGGWQVAYNAACFYSWCSRLDEGSRPEHIQRAIEALGDVVADPDSHLDLRWLCEDPDLELMSTNERFTSWRSLYCQKEEAKMENELEKVTYNWRVLAAWTDAIEGVWTKRRDRMQRWESVESEFEDWSREESKVWRALQVWTDDLDDAAKRGMFKQRILGMDGGPAELPDPQASDGPAETLSAAVLRELWRHVGTIAEPASSFWGGPPAPATVGEARSWGERAGEGWEALHDWATTPSVPRKAGEFILTGARLS